MRTQLILYVLLLSGSFVMQACAPAERNASVRQAKVTAAPAKRTQDTETKGTKSEPVSSSEPDVGSGSGDSSQKLDSIYGMEMKHTKYKDLHADVKNLADAVVMLEVGTGGGTGFFISKDGLLLTNHHVVSKENCNTVSCPGVKVIRSFADGGANQVFESVKMIAANSELDYALLKVDLGEEKLVPYLRVAMNHRFQQIAEKNNYMTLGHPFGASLSLNWSRFQRFSDNTTVRFITIAMPGNSGSPVIYKDSSQVVALHKAGGVDKSRTDVQGWVPHHGSATPMATILKNLLQSFPKMNIENLSAEQFAVDPAEIRITVRPFQNIEEAFKEIYHIQDSKIVLAWVLQQDDPIFWLNKLVETWSFSELFDSLVYDILMEISFAQERMGRTLSAELLAWVQATRGRDDDEYMEDIKLRIQLVHEGYSEEAREKCIQALEKLDILTIRSAVNYCRARVYNSEAIIERYKRLVEDIVLESPNALSENAESMLLSAIMSFENMIDLYELSKEELQQMKEVVSFIGSRARYVRTRYRADGLLNAISNDSRYKSLLLMPL